MNSVFTVFKEQIKSFYLIRRLSVFELRMANNNNYLGVLWEFLNPMIQIALYWFVFGYGIHHGKDPEPGIPFFQWMLAAIVVWFFINQATLESSKSIYTRLNLIAKMNFPMSAIPSYVLFARFYTHFYLLVAVAVIFQLTGFPISIYYVQLPYYMFATLALIFSFSLITSTLAVIVRDVQMVVQSMLRILFYVTPILWTFGGLSPKIKAIMKLNPLYYIVEGYRATFLEHKWFLIEHLHYTLYFWAVVLILYSIGSFLHVKFRSNFVDFL